MAAMKHEIKTGEDLAWLMGHTGGFRGGQVLELHVQKRRVLDEETGRDVVVDTVIDAAIRYDRPLAEYDGLFSVSRVARLTMLGVTDFSIFEQEGTDFSEIAEVHAEAADGRLRFWFDPYGELYVICEGVELEEVSRPGIVHPLRKGTTDWTFQADAGTLPAIGWFLDRLDEAGLPCIWREAKPNGRQHPARRWEGQLLPAGFEQTLRNNGIHVLAYGALDREGFGLTLRLLSPSESVTEKLFAVLTDLIARNFTGLCLAGNQLLGPDEWLGGPGSGRRLLA